jgi:AraC-like DNA-binding protein
MRLYIQNMSCSRCKILVEEELEKLGISHTTIGLGQIEIHGEVPGEKRKVLEGKLDRMGMKVIEDKKNILPSLIKGTLIEMVHYSDGQMKKTISAHLQSRLGYDYHYLSTLFAQSEGETIEHFFLRQKIEKVKELLVYEGQSIKEIAFKLNYSSIAHLSGQFKKMTGLTPTRYRQLVKLHQVSSGNV